MNNTRSVKPGGKLIKKPKSRSKSPIKVPYLKAPLAFWAILFPESDNAGEVIRWWVSEGITGLVINRKEFPDKPQETPQAGIIGGMEIAVDPENFHVSLSFTEMLKFPPVSRPVLMLPGLKHSNPAWKEKHPVQVMLDEPQWSGAREDVQKLFASVVTNISEHIFSTLHRAIAAEKLSIWGTDLVKPYGNPIKLQRMPANKSDILISGPATARGQPVKTRSLVEADQPALERMHELIIGGGRMSIQAAATQVVAEGMAAGYGTDESQTQRLRRRYSRTYGKQKK